MSIEIEKVVTEKFEMKYFKFGAGERTAVILPGLSVKSVMSSADSIASAYRTMRGDYTVYVFDRRLNCPDSYSIDDMAEDTAEAFDLLGLSDVYLFGVSQGGMIAQCIALKRPELVKKLALCSTVSRITDDNSKVIKTWIKLAEEGDGEAVNRSVVEAVFSDEFNEKNGKYIIKLMSGVSEAELKRFITLARGCEGFDISGELGGLRCPTLIVGTKADKVFDFSYIAEVAEKSRAQMKVYEKYGHAVYDETPDCLETLLKFFSGN